MGKKKYYQLNFIDIKVGNYYICESTTSYTYNFRLSNLSSPPEGSTLAAISEIS